MPIQYSPWFSNSLLPALMLANLLTAAMPAVGYESVQKSNKNNLGWIWIDNLIPVKSKIHFWTVCQKSTISGQCYHIRMYVTSICFDISNIDSQLLETFWIVCPELKYLLCNILYRLSLILVFSENIWLNIFIFSHCKVVKHTSSSRSHLAFTPSVRPVLVNNQLTNCANNFLWPCMLIANDSKNVNWRKTS